MKVGYNRFVHFLHLNSEKLSTVDGREIILHWDDSRTNGPASSSVSLFGIIIPALGGLPVNFVPQLPSFFAIFCLLPGLLISIILFCSILFQFYLSEKLNTPDGGEIVLHWLETQSKDDITEPIVVIIPGLTGKDNLGNVVLSGHLRLELPF